MQRTARFIMATLAIAGGVAVFLLAPTSARGQEANLTKLRDEAAQLLAEYLRINTTSPPGNELAAARWLQATLAKEGIESRILDTAELGSGRANLYARLKGSGSKKAIALVHHMDVVPVFGEQWSVDPFAGVIKDGFVWGRGALDDKGQGIVHLVTMVAFKRAGIQLERDIVFIANADEESDATGAIAFTARHADLLADVEYLITEGGGTWVKNGKTRWFGIGVAEKRPYWVSLTVKGGPPSHGSTPRRDNPVPRLARAVARLGAWETPVRVLPAVDRLMKSAARYETQERRLWLGDVKTSLKIPRARRWILSSHIRNALLRNTVTPTVLSASNKTNTIPASASAEVDIRLLPDEDTAVFVRELKRVIGDSAVQVKLMASVPPEYSAPLETDLVRAVELVVAELLPGVQVTTTFEAGASDRPFYAQLEHIAVYGIDPFLLDEDTEAPRFHGNDERVSVENLGFGVNFFISLVKSLSRGE